MKAVLFLLPFVAAIQLLAQSPCESAEPIPFQDHGKWGYLSAKGVVIATKLDLATPFTQEGAIVCSDTVCGLIDGSGSFVAPTWSHSSRPFPNSFSDGLAPAEKDNIWGYIDHLRRIVIPFQFTYAGEFHDGLARVRNGQKFFFIDKKGERVTPEFDGAFDFHEGLAAVEVGKKIGYIRRDGSFALPPRFQGASGIDFSEGLAAFRVNGRTGFMDQSGNVVIAPKYDDVFPFSNGLAPVELHGKWGYIDKTGDLIGSIRYDIAHMFSEGLASVELDGKWGYIDRNGQFAIPPEFDSAMPFCNGVAAVGTFRRLGLENHRGCRAALYQGKHGFIDRSGKYIWRDAEEKTWPSTFCF